MVRHVVATQCTEVFRLRLTVMQVVVREVVDHVPDDESGMKRQSHRAKPGGVKDPEPESQEDEKECDAHRRRHHQSIGITRPGVVNTVN